MKVKRFTIFPRQQPQKKTRSRSLSVYFCGVDYHQKNTVKNVQPKKRPTKKRPRRLAQELAQVWWDFGESSEHGDFFPFCDVVIPKISRIGRATERKF